ncbi:MAG: hypothetical protein AAGC55_13370, partial [Myxococcota bacterium]
RDPLAEVLDELAAEQILYHLDIGPLGEDEAALMRRTLIARGGLAEAAAERLWREAAGHPMLLAELARYAEEAPDEFGRARDFHLEDVIARRASRLSGTHRALLEAVALARRPTPLDVLAQAGRMSPTAGERAATALRAARLISTWSRADHQPWLDACHSRIGEAVAEDMSPLRARVLHSRLARAMDETGGFPAAVLARHFAAAGNRERAGREFLSAAQAAREQLAIEQSLTLYSSAQDQLEALPTSRERADLRCRAWLGQVQCMRIIEDESDALLVLDRAERVAEAHGLDSRLAAVHHLRGNLLFLSGDATGCLREHEKAQVHARRAGSIELEARALGGMGDAYLAGSHMGQAFHHIRRCVALCREHGLTTILVAHLPVLGCSHLFQADPKQAVHDCRAGIADARRLGERRPEMISRIWLGLALIELGHFETACTELETAGEQARALGMQRFVIGAAPALGKAMAQAGRREQAEDLLRDMAMRSRDSDKRFAGPWLLAVLAQVTTAPGVYRHALSEGEALLDSGALGYNAPIFYREAIDAVLYRLLDQMDAGSTADGDDSALDRDQPAARIDRYAEALSQLNRVDPTPWSRYFAARGQALAAFLRDPEHPRNLSALSALSAEGRSSGMLASAYLLDQLIDRLALFRSG